MEEPSARPSGSPVPPAGVRSGYSQQSPVMALLRSSVSSTVRSSGNEQPRDLFPSLGHPLCLLSVVGLDTSLGGSRWVTQPLSDPRLGSLRPSGKRRTKRRWVINSFI